ncbi:hypothetical protein V8C86DRAFT_2498026 [Haematococcus lacustris]
MQALNRSQTHSCAGFYRKSSCTLPRARVAAASIAATSGNARFKQPPSHVPVPGKHVHGPHLQWSHVKGQMCWAVDPMSAEADGTVELEIKVGGMMCDGCTSRVSEALRNACPGKVVNVEVSLPELARVEVRASSQLDAVQMLPTFLQTVEALGFTAEPQIEGL